MRPATRRIRDHLLSWNPRPLRPPQISPNFGRLPPMARAAVSIKFMVLRLEYSLSPMGTLREWVKLNTRLAAYVFPILLPASAVCLVLAKIRDISALLLAILLNILFCILVVIAIGAILSLVAASRSRRR